MMVRVNHLRYLDNMVPTLQKTINPILR